MLLIYKLFREAFSGRQGTSANNQKPSITKENATKNVRISSVFSIFIIVLFSYTIWNWPLFEFPKTKVTQETKEFLWVEKSKDGVRNRLKDPGSAEFKNVQYSNAGGTHVACGQVNSKNSFGAYSGYQRFVAAGEQLVFFENDAQNFANVWNEMCVK